MARYKNVDWNLAGKETDPTVNNVVVVQQALLMDIRDALVEQNKLLNAQTSLLREIRRNTTWSRRKREAKN